MNNIRAAAILMGLMGAEACSSDIDCSLNGVCKSDKCVCDTGFKGDTCAELNLYGGGQVWPEKGSTNASSWGYTTVTDDKGVVHTLVDVACGKDGVLASGGGGSFITHLTSNSVEGEKTVQSMFSVPISFGPHLWKGSSKTYVVFRVNLIPEPGPKDVCPGNGSLPYPGLYNGAILKPPAIKPMPPGEIQPDIWVAETTNVAADDWKVSPAFIKGVGNIHVSNPSVTYSSKLDRHVMAFRMNLQQEAIGIAISDAGSATNYTYTSKVNCTACEDPFIWVDSRDNFHVIWHRGPHGGHAFSKEATDNYITSPIYPFTLNVTYADGSKEVFKRRERPEIQFENGVPKNFFTGVYDQNGFGYTLQQELR
eukprot:TRINITY_DN4855_c0_g3_i2.p1 TRINITY_DN4855_c0_g3~~TRINITY_DN4855_c0_g3_i2.p1  ORF type:complete len:366 (+),score=84.56 TRINITY_DN4855_c0_g3_i2:48-1145(+)